MNNKKYKYLPETNCGETTNSNSYIESDIIGNSPCPCCGFITIPNNGDALNDNDKTIYSNGRTKQ
ncbi:MAG: hypothetical protein ACFWTN_12760 [Clostridium sp.]|jgi:hypothetical protein